MTLNLFDQDTVFEHFLEHREKEWLEEGRAEGRAETIKETMQKMRSEGYTEEQIARLFS